MKLPTSNPLAELIPNPEITLRITPPVIPTHEEVVKFISRKGKVHSHAVQSWAVLEAEVLRNAGSKTETANSETSSSTEYLSASE